MYFFLSNLSLLDLLFSTSAVPLIMANSLQNFPTISYTSCFAQLTIRAFLALAECFLLAIMAYDRFVAISDPLRYNLVMSSRVCILMALLAWMTAFLLTVMPILLFPISFCGHNSVNHFSCEAQAIFKLLCSNTIFLEVMMMVCAVISMPVPLIFILISYLCILRAVLRIHPTEARLKAFSTCGSHLVVVTIYFGTLIYIYVRPQTKKSQDGDKIVSILYAAVTPMLNPLIYTLRNKDVKAALRRAPGAPPPFCGFEIRVCAVLLGLGAPPPFCGFEIRVCTLLLGLGAPPPFPGFEIRVCALLLGPGAPPPFCGFEIRVCAPRSSAPILWLRDPSLRTAARPRSSAPILWLRDPSLRTAARPPELRPHPLASRSESTHCC
ncbi:olfactory receptor 13H1-like [Pteropus vampyrus]|uniref:Olfactory receptor n=1 Tax=Pteropus vampyrus TaxID=132908 RepID=A0A6P3RH69_PTEVA|nr:olfactory receptor 13H1-like [Pteropus vampyrus]